MNRRNQESQSENWITGVRRRLATRREEKPETKGGQIWALWPEIKAALEDGQTFKSIRLWLEEEGGVTVTLGSLRSYVRRCRRKEGGRRADTVAPAQPTFNKPNPLWFRFSPRCRRPLCRCEMHQNHRHKHL